MSKQLEWDNLEQAMLLVYMLHSARKHVIDVKQKKQCMKHFSQTPKAAIVMSLSKGHSPQMVMRHHKIDVFLLILCLSGSSLSRPRHRSELGSYRNRNFGM
jgi:hypothetical protein